MAPLFSSRAGIHVFGEGVMVRFTWPTGKIALDTESLTVNALIKQFQIPFSQIERLETTWMTVRVVHHAPNVPGWIVVSGFRLPRRLRDAITKHNLPVQFEI